MQISFEIFRWGPGEILDASKFEHKPPISTLCLDFSIMTWWSIDAEQNAEEEDISDGLGLAAS